MKLQINVDSIYQFWHGSFRVESRRGTKWRGLKMVDQPEQPLTKELIRLCDESKNISEMILTLPVRQRLSAISRRVSAIIGTMNDAAAH